ETSLKDLRAASGDLSMATSNTDISNHLMKQDRDLNQSQKIIKKYNNRSNEPQFQSGVLRTNCIDCLDRTNVAQYAYGLAALGRQLHAMGLTDNPKVDPDSSIAAALMDMYQNMGDALAQQYGGSAAHNTVFPERQGKWKATTQSREFLKSIKRYYSNAYTDGEKQDAINLFLGYFQPKDGKPALWELDSDYYLHVSGIGDDLVPEGYSPADAEPIGMGNSLTPISACKEDFSKLKLTSFDKLIERTSGSIKNVRLCSEPDHKPGNSGMAPDAVEIQLKSPNWLFGHKKFEASNSTQKVASDELAMRGREDEKKFDDLCDPNWISSASDSNQEEVFRSEGQFGNIHIYINIKFSNYAREDGLLNVIVLGDEGSIILCHLCWLGTNIVSQEKALRSLGSECKVLFSGILFGLFIENDQSYQYLALTSVDEPNEWYGGTLLSQPDENSEVYKHYAQFCQNPVMEPFQDDTDKEKYYAELLQKGTVDCVDDANVEAEMEAALKEYELIGADLGICPKAFNDLAIDPSHLTRWMIGEQRANKIFKKCDTCGGQGAIDCAGCKGTGKNKKNGNIFERWKCYDCQGFGLRSCPSCGKGGLTPEQRGER
ncbi:phosphoinositide phosphatase SAC1-like protein isoform X6, partial [Tanacetum coccineum]